MNGNATPKLKTKTAVSVILIVIFFVWALVFFYSTFSIDAQTFTGKLTILSGAIIAELLLFVGIAVGARADARTITAGSILLFVWSLGFLVIPTPEGYGEGILGLYAILLLVIVASFYECRKFRKRNKKMGKPINVWR